MINKIKIPIVLIIIGVSILAITFLFISHFIISGAIMNMEQTNYNVNVSAIGKPVVEKIDVNSAYPFNFGSTYIGIQGTENIKIKNLGNNIEEFNVNNPSKKYILKSVNNKGTVGIQFDRYDNNKLIGRYNILNKDGSWVGVYTNNNDDIVNVKIQ